ncbi:MAG: HIT family protein [Spirochaetales bacterium]|nr:HIT family protein [Spirochaetales bacterium]
MTNDPTCFYCQPNEKLDSLMIEVEKLELSTLYLFLEQTHRGRCILACNHHVKELSDLRPEDLGAFARDLSRAAAAIIETVKPAKLNYGAYGDKMPHLHFHLVPKVENEAEWGSIFEMNPQKVYYSHEENGKLIDRLRLALGK